MIEIETYLRSPDGKFTPIDSCADRPPDADYVEGAVRISIHGVEIIGLEEWDYVDQLWAYMSSMLPQLSASGYASTYLPDQPIELSFRRQGSQALVSVKSGNRTQTASIPMSDFVTSVKGAGEAFFRKMSDLLPENSQSYLASLQELSRL